MLLSFAIQHHDRVYQNSCKAVHALREFTYRRPWKTPFAYSDMRSKIPDHTIAANVPSAVAVSDFSCNHGRWVISIVTFVISHGLFPL